VTVAGEATAVPDADRAAAETLFTEIYQAHSRRLTQFIYWHLPFEMTDLAEDFAQETFQDLWAHLLKGRSVDYPFALLKTIASRQLADHHKVKRNSMYLATDLETPEFSVVEVARGHQYAPGNPELAGLSDELDNAMERMRTASARWRKLHGQVASMRKEETRAEAAKQRDAALIELQDACWTVGDLRAELERAGGDSWRSPTGWPVSFRTDGRHRKGGASSDLDVTHCVNGHHLHLENVTFLEDGTRACRACAKQATRRVRAKAEAGANR
jgi:DNA-directed RNA polymerase specialized sigma24 family protein